MPRVVARPPQQEMTPDYLLTTKILNAYKDAWAIQLKESGADPMLYARLSVVAMSQWLAIVGVDIGMSQEQFLAVCKANFETAYQKAPKFS
jgi:hypothetical protein